MKLALVTETYPPEVNGVAMTLRRLVKGLTERGHEVEVVRPRQQGEAPQGAHMFNAERGIAQWLVPGMPIPFYQSLRIGVPAWGALHRRWLQTKPDLVHVATEGPLGLAATRAARRLGLPVTSSFHTNFHQYGGHYGLRFARNLALRYLRRFHNRTVCTMVPTEGVRRQLAADRFERLLVIGRGVDAQLFSPEKRSEALRATWGAKPEDQVAIYVGRIAAEKNLGLAVEAFLAMQAIEPRARFVLVGDGPERPALALKYPQFHYAGMRGGEDLAAHYASADVFIFPSTTETFGNVITEAMASGLVVLAYDYAAAHEHLRVGENGFAAAFEDHDAFVATARRIMQQRETWPQVRAAARATALGITWDAIVDQFEAALVKAWRRDPAEALASGLGPR